MTKKQQVHVRMSPELYRAVVARAKAEERSIAQVIERTLRAALLKGGTNAAR